MHEDSESSRFAIGNSREGVIIDFVVSTKSKKKYIYVECSSVMISTIYRSIPKHNDTVVAIEGLSAKAENGPYNGLVKRKLLKVSKVTYTFSISLQGYRQRKFIDISHL